MKNTFFNKADSIEEFLKENEDLCSEVSSNEGKNEQIEEDDGCENEIILQDQIDRGRIKLSKSSASCSLSDIQGIVFGGVSSRYWMLRKHIN